MIKFTEKWIQTFKKIFNEIDNNEDHEYLLIALEDRCYERGYNIEETNQIVKFVKEG